ncbi:Ribosomal-protein-alanine acetyltransferase [Thermus sp. CCB_US3_UF1]|uniref:GNAT family N-acetyltransferase n=1 Tax=Thermus sp. CCB_US3_UF1 TaxID=1111069 RepID=UPI00023899B7|nr:GNAT family protein [Thermus sp. CCB_US3_UF1]AEV15327.1 Ribosomal-protein-alanine acetyltransferase [Thermus sp. CCB_US3_UF1]
MWSFPQRLVGRYVRLEPLSLAHLSGFLAQFDPEVYRFLSRMPLEPTEEALKAHLEGLLAEPGRVNWAVYLGEELAGRISVIAPDPEHRKLEMGTMIFKPFWGSPANKEAKYLLLRHAFEVLGAERVQFKVNLKNERSQRALESLGAVREGVLRKNRRLPDGTFRDDVVYSILREEWPGVRAGLEARLYGPGSP